MTFWKAWFDVRLRFVLCAILATVTFLPASFDAAVNAEGYGRIVEGWIGGMEYPVFATLVIVLGVGGTTTEANARSNLMTLSLPVPRSRWLVSQWLVATLLVFCLTAWILLLTGLAGILSGRSVPVAALLGAVVLNGFAAALWVWPAMLGTSVMKGAVRAALVVVSLLMVFALVRNEPIVSDWHIGNLADLRAWQEALPWRALLVGFLLGGGSAWLTLRRFQRTDY